MLDSVDWGEQLTILALTFPVVCIVLTVLTSNISNRNVEDVLLLALLTELVVILPVSLLAAIGGIY